MTRSARDRKASSIASMKFVVVTKSTAGRLRAISSIPSITASVARCTSTGLVSNEALVRRTAKLSTSSISTTVCGRRAASSGIVSCRSRMMLRWLSPSMSLGNACGLISTSVVAPSRASANAATCASPRASVVLPVPGGPASTIWPCGSPASCESLRPCLSVSSACESSRSFTPPGTMIASQSLSWWSAGRVCSDRTPGGSAGFSTIGPAVFGPVDLGNLFHAEQRIFRFLKKDERIGERAHGLEDRIEHVHADEARFALRVVVEVLVPQEMVDDDEVALLPAVVLALIGRGAHEAVAVALDDVEPRLAGVAMERLRLPRRELDHHLGNARGLAADRSVDQELGARAARRGEEVLLVVGRVDAPAATLFRFVKDTSSPPGVGVVAFNSGTGLRRRG